MLVTNSKLKESTKEIKDALTSSYIHSLKARISDQNALIEQLHARIFELIDHKVYQQTPDRINEIKLEQEKVRAEHDKATVPQQSKRTDAYNSVMDKAREQNKKRVMTPEAIND